MPLTEPRRARVFPPGTAIGMHLRVERLIRVAGDRVTYLVNNHQPRWYTRKCWVCGHKHSPTTATHCVYCAASLRPRRFLMTARWDLGSALVYQAWVQRRLSSPALCPPLALYRYQEQLLAVFPWEGEQILAHEPAPLDAAQVLSIGFQAADALSFLHAYGVVLSRLAPTHVLVSPDGAVRLFDLDVGRMVDRSLPANPDATLPPQRDLRELAAMLAPYVSPTDTALLDLLRRVRAGEWQTADDLASAFQRFAWTRKEHPARAPVAAMTDSGVERERNEDAWAWSTLGPDRLAVVVADGMGGLEGGDEASRLACRTILRTAGRRLGDGAADARAIGAALREGFAHADQAIRQLARDRDAPMGSTAVAVVSTPSETLVASLGDSRVYLLRDGALRQVTEDHTAVAALIAAGRLDPTEARNHPKAGLLTAALGGAEGVESDLFELDARSGDRLLLCTDGLCNEVPDDQILAVLLDEPDPRRAARRLVRAANDAGGRDNVTVAVVDLP